MSPQPLRTVSGIAAPLRLANIDTDAIAPSRAFPKDFAGFRFADMVFANWRFDADGQERTEFVLNQDPYRDAVVLIGGENFGCGSSREYAVWALQDFGIQAVVAPSFGTIFRANCLRNGVLPLELAEPHIDELDRALSATEPHIQIDVVQRWVRPASGEAPTFTFELASRPHTMLINGLDELAETQQHLDAIRAFHSRDQAERPWIYGTIV